jgi:hypothetical protein
MYRGRPGAGSPYPGPGAGRFLRSGSVGSFSGWCAGAGTFHDSVARGEPLAQGQVRITFFRVRGEGRTVGTRFSGRQGAGHRLRGRAGTEVTARSRWDGWMTLGLEAHGFPHDEPARLWWRRTATLLFQQRCRLTWNCSAADLRLLYTAWLRKTGLGRAEARGGGGDGERERFTPAPRPLRVERALEASS